MSMNYTGTVANVLSRTVVTRWGPKPVYDLVVADGKKFSWGFKSPSSLGVTDGAEIKFDYIEDKYGSKVVDGSVLVISSGTGATPTPVSTPAKAPATGGREYRSDAGFPVPVTSDKISILRQNALTNARETVMLMPSLFFAEKANFNGDDVVKEIIRVAGIFADYTSGRDVERKVKKLTDKMREEG